MNDEEKKKNTRYLKDKDGFKIPSIDPIQDIMDDNELKNAEDRINMLIEQDDQEAGK